MLRLQEILERVLLQQLRLVLNTIKKQVNGCMKVPLNITNLI
jgi:hypothetical protein